MKSGRPQPTKTGRNNLTPPNSIIWQDGSGRAGVGDSDMGIGVRRRSPFLLARTQEEERGREGFESPRS